MVRDKRGSNTRMEQESDNMRAWNGFATLCAIGLLGGDAIVGASIGKVAFHAALLIVNLVCYLMSEW